MNQPMKAQKSKTEVEVGSYYKSPRTRYGFKIIAVNRQENYCCIVDKNERHETIPLDNMNNYLLKGKIEKESIKKQKYQP